MKHGGNARHGELLVQFNQGVFHGKGGAGPRFDFFFHGVGMEIDKTRYDQPAAEIEGFAGRTMCGNFHDGVMFDDDIGRLDGCSPENLL